MSHLYAEIPENRELEYLQPHPAVPLDKLADLPDVGTKLVIFHNGQDPMCRDAKAFTAALDYPVEEHLTEERNFLPMLERNRAPHGQSEGVSTAFEYFPLIFVNGRVFSGFDDDVKAAIEAEIKQ